MLSCTCREVYHVVCAATTRRAGTCEEPAQAGSHEGAITCGVSLSVALVEAAGVEPDHPQFSMASRREVKK
jgi:hypothetical protein